MMHQRNKQAPRGGGGIGKCNGASRVHGDKVTTREVRTFYTGGNVRFCVDPDILGTLINVSGV
jgi:hypothetical protein